MSPRAHPLPRLLQAGAYLLALLLVLLFVLLAGPAMAQTAPASTLQAGSCKAQILHVDAARASALNPQLPAPSEGWEPVTLPDRWTQRWPAHDGAVWYRIAWQRSCASPQPGLDAESTAPPKPIALGIDGISVAGAVYVNHDLLWSDASLVEPLSRSWNVPRWWLLPESLLQPGVNTIWVYAVGHRALSPGLGQLRLGSPQEVAQVQAGKQWRQRTVYFVNAVLCAMAGVLFFSIWLLQRKARTYGWFALMALCWMLYLSTYLAGSQWPWPDSLTRARFSLVALLGYVLSVCIFTFRFGAQKLPWVERFLWLLAFVGAAVTCLVPAEHARQGFSLVWQGATAVFLVNGLQFQVHAWFPRKRPRNLAHILLACIWLLLTLVALNNLYSVLDRWQVARDWAALSGVLVIGLLMLLLGGQLVRQMHEVRRFNRELKVGVESARSELAQALQREHVQALENAKLQERMALAHDLHDGLGGALVRSMALVEQADETISSARVLSLLKSMRDDLNQLIDYGSSAGASVPDTPVQWAAPLRHRITRILDEIGVQTHWSIAAQWQGSVEEGKRPNALQCLLLTRLVEEALSNVIKHSHASKVRVEYSQPRPNQLLVRVEDDGVGFDVQAVQRAGQSVGMRSMAARAERLGASFSVQSSPAGTMVTAVLQLGAGLPAAAPGAAAR